MEKNPIKKHPVLSGFIGFMAFTLPQTISSYLDLWQRFEEANVHINWFQWVLPILPILGVGLFAVVLWQTRKPTSQSPSSDQTKKKEPTESLFDQCIKHDAENLGSRFYTRDFHYSFDNLKETDSFMRMTVTIINATVFPILIEGVKANNRFLIEEQECAYAAEMEGQTRIPHGEYANISIKQHISQEMMNLILTQNMRKQSIRISLKSCRLVVRPEIAGKESDPVNIGFTFDQEVPIPELKRE